MRVLNSVLALGVALTACKAEAPKKPVDEKPVAAPVKKAAVEKPADSAAVEVPPGDGPVAKVDGVDIDRAVFNREYKQTMQRYKKARHDVKPALKERLKDNIVRRLVDAQIIEARAKKMGIEVPAEELAQKWEDHKKRYGSEEAFNSFLERAGTSADDVKRTFVNNLLREQVFAAAAKDLSVTKKEVRAFYKENEKRYQEPEQIKASHILLRVPPDASAEVKAQKKKQAEDLLKQAKAGTDFAELAKKFGEDPTKDRGGDLGFFSKQRMVKPFEEAVWNLKKGQLAPVVETQFGFHVVKKTDAKKARNRPFAEVEEQIERSLLARKRNEAIRNALATWKEEAKIEIFVKGDADVIAAGTKLQRIGSKAGAEQRKATQGAIKLRPNMLRPKVNDAPAQ